MPKQKKAMSVKTDENTLPAEQPAAEISQTVKIADDNLQPHQRLPLLRSPNLSQPESIYILDYNCSEGPFLDKEKAIRRAKNLLDSPETSFPEKRRIGIYKMIDMVYEESIIKVYHMPQRKGHKHD